jgi:hypothetical protein
MSGKGGTGETGESSKFSELRTSNFESCLSRTSYLSRSRFTRKRSEAAIALEALMNNAG